MATQLPGLGFPMLRFVMLFSLATAAVCGFAEARYEGKETGEPALMRSLFDRLSAGDILLGDACFCSYFMIALLVAQGVDVVFHQHLIRQTMASAAAAHECTPRKITFAGALQAVAGVICQTSVAKPALLEQWEVQKLESIASHRVGNRPNRVEPRAIKRRPKNHKLLTKPRHEARAELGAAAAAV